MELQQQHGSFSAFIWSFVEDGQPIINSWTRMDQVPTRQASGYPCQRFSCCRRALNKPGKQLLLGPALYVAAAGNLVNSQQAAQLGPEGAIFNAACHMPSSTGAIGSMCTQYLKPNLGLM